MGASVQPEYSPDNPFAQGKTYSPDNPFAGTHHNKPKIGQMGHAITTDESDDQPGIGTKILGSIAALNRDIPGAEAAQSGIRSVIRGQSYEQARNDIRGAEDAAPTAATLPARLLGGGMAAVAGGQALGLGAKGAGALYGGLSGLGDSEPMSKDDRVGNTIAGAAIGGLAGAAGQKAGRIGSRVMAPVIRGGTSMLRSALDAAPSIMKSLEGISLPAEALRSGESAVAKQGTAVNTRLQSLLAAVRAQNEAPAQIGAGQTHRTIAQFRNFAERMGTSTPESQSTGGQLHSILDKLRASQPEEAGNGWGDAEEAMGQAPHQQPDLEALLRESLKMLPGATQTPLGSGN